MRDQRIDLGDKLYDFGGHTVTLEAGVIKVDGDKIGTADHVEVDKWKPMIRVKVDNLVDYVDVNHPKLVSEVILTAIKLSYKTIPQR